ncbi:MAG: helix-turn-helix domain-containing protein [Cyclobacteriaceae bacterium]
MQAKLTSEWLFRTFKSMSATDYSNRHRHYTSYPVSPALSKYIDCVWMERFSHCPEFRGRDHLIVPDNTVELIFTMHKIERRFNAGSQDAMICKSHVAGLKTRPQYVKITGEVLLAVRFMPQGLYRFTDIPLTDTIDQSIPTEYLFGTDIQQLEQQLLGAEKHVGQVALVNDYFTKKLFSSKRQENELFDHIAQRIIQSDGRVKIRDLSTELNISTKTIERRFQEYLGISPKRYCQLIRFFQSLKTPFDPRKDCLGSLAYSTGYYDQMHFIKDVKKYTGLTPSVYFGMDKGIQGPIFL